MLFDDVHQALAYYRYKNPARAVYKNILEQEKNTSNVAEQFSGDHPADIWASILGATQSVLKHYRPDEKRLFELVELDDDRLHPTDAAAALFMSTRTAYRRLRQIKEDLERELQRRELVEFKD